MKVRASYATGRAGGITCRLCPNSCFVAPGKTGRCLGRRNIEGNLYAVNYGEVVTMVVDPIEKKPLYHFYPGSDILSVATYGCNLACPFCQNCDISQQVVPARYVSPERLVRLARDRNSPGVAFTYTEPMVWFEYLRDAGRLLREQGLTVVLVTNGMVNPEPLAELLPLVDAMNVDLKSVRRQFYADYVKGSMEAVTNTIESARASCHVELTTLLIPGRNDSREEIRDLVRYVAGLGRDTVLHLSRYFPRHRATEPPTPAATMLRAAEMARESLDYVFLGNMDAGPEYRDTRCPDCGSQQVERRGYRVAVVGVQEGKCCGCGRPVDFVV